MTIEYTIVAAVLAALYLIVKKFLPDFPITDQVFGTVVLYLLAKIGVIVVGAPVATAIRRLFGKG